MESSGHVVSCWWKKEDYVITERDSSTRQRFFYSLLPAHQVKMVTVHGAVSRYLKHNRGLIRLNVTSTASTNNKQTNAQWTHYTDDEKKERDRTTKGSRGQSPESHT